jgi:hypothetical protein
MNPINHATLEQAKRMEELGYPQDKTDCVWRQKYRESNEYVLIARNSRAFEFGLKRKYKWYAVPNAQEIELDSGYIFINNEQDLIMRDGKSFGESHYAQARADAYIWEKENLSHNPIGEENGKIKV